MKCHAGFIDIGFGDGGGIADGEETIGRLRNLFELELGGASLGFADFYCFGWVVMSGA